MSKIVLSLIGGGVLALASGCCGMNKCGSPCGPCGGGGYGAAPSYGAPVYGGAMMPQSYQSAAIVTPGTMSYSSAPVAYGAVPTTALATDPLPTY